jgi:DNA adenine methylase
MKPPRYVGAKRAPGVWQRILSEMPAHDTWIEAFAGTGWITQMKLPAASSIVIDADPAAPALTMAAARTICGDARSWLRQFSPEGRTLVYLDPPYLGTTRAGGAARRYYRCELLTDGEHVELLELAKSLPCYVMISGYWSELYESHLREWRACSIPTVDRAGRRREEWLWMNFPDSTPRHDHRYTGDNFRERERISRKARRWRRKLDAMPPAERSAVLAALAD